MNFFKYHLYKLLLFFQKYHNKSLRRKKMQIERFKRLSLSVQSSYLFIEGEHICTSTNEYYVCKLYTLYGRLIEVKLCRIKKQVETISVLDHYSNVDRYLDQIMLPKEIMPK